MSLYQLALLLLFAVLLALGVFLFWPRSRREGTTTAASRASASPIDRQDARYWLGGMIYNNPDDPDLFVPKRIVPGTTLNIGHPVGRLIFFGMLLFVLAMAVLLAAGVITPYGCHPSGCSF